MNTLIIVGKGHIGSYLASQLSDDDDLNVDHWHGRMEELTPTIIYEIAGDRRCFIVNTAGKTDLTWCESNPLEALHNNVAAPLQLARAARTIGATYIHLGSGCVWDGPYDETGSPFTVHHPVTPACHYSWTKAACDAMLLSESDKDVHILRPRQVFSSVKSPRNTLAKLVGYKALLNTPNSMTSIDTIIKTVLHIVEHGGPELINVYDTGISSPFEIGTMLAEAGLREKPDLLSKDQLDGFHKPKRVDTVLHDEWLEKAVRPPHVHKALQNALNDYKNIN